jgi:hypothetical protein
VVVVVAGAQLPGAAAWLWMLLLLRFVVAAVAVVVDDEDDGDHDHYHYLFITMTAMAGGAVATLIIIMIVIMMAGGTVASPPMSQSKQDHMAATQPAAPARSRQLRWCLSWRRARQPDAYSSPPPRSSCSAVAAAAAATAAARLRLLLLTPGVLALHTVSRSAVVSHCNWLRHRGQRMCVTMKRIIVNFTLN